MSSAPQSTAASIEQQIEALATILDTHGLTRIELQQDDTSIVLEKQTALPAVAATTVQAIPAVGLPAVQGVIPAFGASGAGAGGATGNAFGSAADGAAGFGAVDVAGAAGVAAGAVAPAGFAAATSPAATAATAAGAAGAAATAAGAPASPADANPQEPPVKQQVMAPLVGIAYRSAEPGTPPLVSVGDTVQEGDVLCLIEAMKMFNEIKAPCSGTVSGIHFTDADLVEHGALLFSLS